jgi:hypothetical protein
MRIQIWFALLVLVLCSLAVAGEKAYAPLPDKVVTAKTVFFVNESGTARFGDDLYQQIEAWNRWKVVTDRTKADLELPPDILSLRVEPYRRTRRVAHGNPRRARYLMD